ncbi:MAG TPA: NADH-quinone oxidoreductase subunit NuoE [Flexivirga sp.]|uniref:NADH-quinone oxidoreductase subunit NuoE n=1 Tax=Flexivirga sp. TaxID=1962927 RepID=UPI002CDA58EE|nr:NADH-quinone oxidoreductase subunit NuoE [Flexivirga sp.]HWC24792.1 NADH-quinone oxidoreductase subunit NuoE [Flexivirga sp.]
MSEENKVHAEVRAHASNAILHPQTPLRASDEPYTDEQLTQLNRDIDEIIGRYPVKRSALLPMLHLIQSVDGFVSGRGVRLCAERLGLSDAEVSGVATFYTQYKRHPNGDYTIGVCTNTLCAVMGGDLIFERLSDHLGVGHDETTEDGKITLERVECNAACDYAPVVMANWEFFDKQTPDSAVQMADDLRAGKDVAPTRGAAKVCSFKHVERVLAGFPDGHANEGVGAGEPSLEGLRLAHQNDWRAPGDEGGPLSEDNQRNAHQNTATTGETGGPLPGHPHSSAEGQED